jgi:stage II sporulation protein E
MLERLEIYPYQRVEEEFVPRQARRKLVPTWHLPQLQFSKIFHAGNLYYSADWLKSMMRWENLFLAGGAVILSRAFILGELLPFIFAFVAVFAVQNRMRSIVLCFSA